MPELLNTRLNITVEQADAIVLQLRAINVNGKYVFSRVWIENSGGGIYICADNWGSVGRFLFYMTEEEKLKIDFD